MTLDEQILRAARTRGHRPRAEHAAADFSRLGEHGGIWIALALAGALLDAPERRRRWQRGGAVVCTVYLANTALKLLVGRPRPQLPGLPPLVGTPTQLSFPSAHAATSFAGARLYSRMGLPATPLYTLAVALSLSRLYLGVHYPSDLLAGALLGTVLAAIAAPSPVGTTPSSPERTATSVATHDTGSESGSRLPTSHATEPVR